MMKLKETMAALSVVLSLIGVPVLVGCYHQHHIRAGYSPETKIINVTGVGDAGVFTLASVNAANYWWKDFTAATINLDVGDEVVLRLHSADVTHRFYVPELGVGPVDIEPGHTEIVQFTVATPGRYRYYCTSICGDCHFYMQGWIVVARKGETPEPHDASTCEHTIEEHFEFGEPSKEYTVAWGRYLHRKMGCVTCHGIDGVGGIVNPNYIKGTIPAHNTLAEKFFLREEVDADTFAGLLLEDADFDQLKEDLDIPLLGVVMGQHMAARQLILEGKEAAKLDAGGPEPPLHMPSWRAKLTERDIDAIIAYLLSLYEWEDDEE